MTSRPLAVTVMAVAIVLGGAGRGWPQERPGSWLDKTELTAWNNAGAAIPVAPKLQAINPRCRETARPPALDEDTRVRERGWELVGAYQGGWAVLVIRGTAGYDGMCRPIQYQDFVFVRGAFAGTLAPRPMDSRTDGALGHVSLQGQTQLTAEYSRYETSDALCCPSRTTSVTFEIAKDPAVVRPVSASTSRNMGASGANRRPGRPFEGTYWRAVELAGKPISAQDPRREAHLEFQAGRVSGSDGCNRIVGSYQRNVDRVTFRQMAGTQMACLDPTGTEAPFRDALSKTTRLSLVGDRLDLFDAAGTRLARLVAVQRPSEPLVAPASAGLAGTSWQLVKFEGGDGMTLMPDDRAKYTIEFAAGGHLAARIDCNRGRGTWKSTGSGRLDLGPLALTRAQCAPGSLYDQIVKQWSHIRSYVVEDGHLFLALTADGGIYELEPIAKQK